MPAMQRLRGILASLALALLVAGCGSTASPRPSAPITPPPIAGCGLQCTGLCPIFGAARAATVLGEPVGDGEGTQGAVGGLSYSCRYEGASGALLDLQYFPGQTRSEWDADMDATEMSDNTAIDGIGDAAWLSDSSGFGPGARISAVSARGVVWVTIAKVDGNDAALAEAVKQAARELLDLLDAS
jgi:hypothetical protein